MKKLFASLMAAALVSGIASADQVMDVPAGAELLGFVAFGSGASTTDMSNDVLANVAKKLRDNPEMIIVAEGHTDAVGSEQMNVDLAMKRANEVRSMLVKAHGADGARVHVRGIGERRPIASNDTADGRAKNRRVELYLSKSGNLYKDKNMTMQDAGSGKANVGSNYPEVKNVMSDKGAGKSNVGSSVPAPDMKKADVGKF